MNKRIYAWLFVVLLTLSCAANQNASTSYDSGSSKKGKKSRETSYETVSTNKSSSEFPELASSYDATGKAVWRPSKGYDIPMVKDARVNQWVGYFTGGLRKNFARWLSRASYYGPLMETILKEYHLPKDLLYLAMIESGFNLSAYSSAAATGPWQFIRSTGKMYGLNNNTFVDDRRHVIKATRAAASHLRDLYRMYGDWHLAFAAYNGGPGNVNKAIRKSGSRNFWKARKFMPAETRDYVPRILAAAIVSKNYKKYGFSSNLFVAPMAVDQVIVPSATDVAVLAKCAGTSVETMRYLNPSLLLGVTPPNKKYAVFVPRGQADDFSRNYARVPKSDRVNMVFHQVKKKESLASIAHLYKVSSSKIAKANGLSGKNAVATGRVLVIPKDGKSVMKSFSMPADYQDSSIKYAKNDAKLLQSVAGGSTQEISDNPAEQPQGDSEVVVATNTESTTVASTTTPSSTGNKTPDHASSLISKDLASQGVSPVAAPVEEKQVVVASANKTVEKDEVAMEVEKDLKADLGSVTSSMGDEAPQKTYEVRSGDSLSTIAKAHGMKTADLRELNGIKGNEIKAGQKLVIEERVASSDDFVSGAIVADSGKTYTVKMGDTLIAIAKKNGVSVDDLKAWNGFGSKTILRVGQEVKVSNPQAKANGKPSPLSQNIKTKSYSVKSGDTLSAIAQKNGVDEQSIKQWNKMKGTTIQVGQVLFLEPEKKMIIHAVRQGETLWDLSRKYNVSIDDLKKWNNLKGNSLQPTQKLRIVAQGEGTSKKS